MFSYPSAAFLALAGLAFNPLAGGDTLYVADTGKNTVSQYDATTGAAIGSFTPITGLARGRFPGGSDIDGGVVSVYGRY
jgi:DNA-binding beta-propeller fold protein YncE